MLFSILLGSSMLSQESTANIFKNSTIATKVDNVVKFSLESKTLKQFKKEIFYIVFDATNENTYGILITDSLSDFDQQSLICFDLGRNRILTVIADESTERFSDEYRNNYALKSSANKITCPNKSGKRTIDIPVSVFGYVIFDETFSYLFDLMTFDSLQFLKIEFDLK